MIFLILPLLRQRYVSSKIFAHHHNLKNKQQIEDVYLSRLRFLLFGRNASFVCEKRGVENVLLIDRPTNRYASFSVVN